jgi:hypothetical protein
MRPPEARLWAPLSAVLFLMDITVIFELHYTSLCDNSILTAPVYCCESVWVVVEKYISEYNQYEK